jgi:FkbM family methyltransferase
VTLPGDSFGFFLEAYDLARELYSSGNAKYRLQAHRLLITVDELVFNLTTSEELFILHEIFVKRAYGFDFGERCVVIDVGMNVGVASLYFASFPQVDNVVGFEPFRPTLEQAKVNLGHNVNLSRKIRYENFGLGPKDETLQVSYNYSNKGQVGIHGTALVADDVTRVEKETILIKDASTVVKGIVNEFPDRAFILKLDCEGSEYGILQNLFDSRLLSVFKIVFIEWHRDGAEPLLKCLRQSGFVSFHQRTSKTVGMIYAAK